MQPTDRAALVEELYEIADAFTESALKDPPTTRGRFIEAKSAFTLQIMPIIDRLLAERTSGPAHPDDDAVDEFAERMKAKLAQKRADGRFGWDDPNVCSREYLSGILHKHVTKGDPVDVANIAMMIGMRGERIAERTHTMAELLAATWGSTHDAPTDRMLKTCPTPSHGDDLDALQSDIAAWAQDAFPGTPEPSIFNKLETEVREMAMARHNYWIESGKGNAPENADPQDVATEAADVLFMLFQIAGKFDFDLLEETRRKFEINKARTWERQPDGTYQHKEEASDAT